MTENICPRDPHIYNPECKYTYILYVYAPEDTHLLMCHLGKVS